MRLPGAGGAGIVSIMNRPVRTDDDAQPLMTRIRALQAEGRTADAEELARQAVAARPDDVEALSFLGVAAFGRGDMDAAIAHFRAAVRAAPGLAAPLVNLGKTYAAAGRRLDAIEAYRRSVRIDPRNATIWYKAGHLYHLERRLDEAAACYRKAIRLKPDHAHALLNLGDVLMAQKNEDAAFDAYLRGLTHRPDVALAHSNVGHILLNRGRPEEALGAFRRAAALAPDDLQIRINLGLMLLRLERSDEACEHLEAAVAAAPESFSAHYNLGLALQHRGAWEASAEHFARAAALEPDNAEARVTLALMLLRLGRFREGWAANEARFERKARSVRRHTFAQPLWDGAPLDGRTLLVTWEQGLGNTLQFARLLPLAAERGGGPVVFQCQREAVRLLRTMPGPQRIIGQDDPQPDFHVHLSLLSLARVLAVDEATIPRTVPYLSPPGDPPSGLVLPANRRERRIGHGGPERRNSGGGPERRIGLAWAGSPKHARDAERSCPLEALRPLFDLPGIAWYSLQKGAQSVEPRALGLAERIVDLTPHINDLADTAHAAAAMDLIITVDTALGHIAGAMGRPVWELLNFNADWRWMLDRDDSPWYPHSRLFRQPRRGDWASVVAEVRAALGGPA